MLSMGGMRGVSGRPGSLCEECNFAIQGRTATKPLDFPGVTGDRAREVGG